MYKIFHTAEAKKLFQKLPPLVKSQIKSLTKRLAENPHDEGKPLRYDLEGYYSAKHSRYRVIYKVLIEKKEILISYVGHRQDIYELFSKFLQKKKTIKQ